MLQLLTSRYRIPADVLFHRMGDEILIMDMKGGHFYNLHSVGSQVWLCVSENGTVEKALAQALTEYQTDEQTLGADVAEFLRQMTVKGLLVVEP